MYVAAVEDADGPVSIALAVERHTVTAYICGDDPTRDAYPGWFVGAATTVGAFRLARDDWSFAGAWSATHAEGTFVEPNGVSLTWSAARVETGALTGLYAAADSGCTTGVIVIDDPAAPEPIVRGAWCDAKGAVLQVTPVLPIELVAGRLAVQVALATGVRRLYVAPLGALPSQ